VCVGVSVIVCVCVCACFCMSLCVKYKCACSSGSEWGGTSGMWSSVNSTGTCRGGGSRYSSILKLGTRRWDVVLTPRPPAAVFPAKDPRCTRQANEWLGGEEWAGEWEAETLVCKTAWVFFSKRSADINWDARYTNIFLDYFYCILSPKLDYQYMCGNYKHRAIVYISLACWVVFQYTNIVSKVYPKIDHEGPEK